MKPRVENSPSAESVLMLLAKVLNLGHGEVGVLGADATGALTDGNIS